MARNFTEDERYAIADKLRMVYEYLFMIDFDGFDYEATKDSLVAAVEMISPKYAEDWWDEYE